MKVEFLEVSTRIQAKKLAPWASVITKVEGGYRAFESFDDFKTWARQQ